MPPAKRQRVSAPKVNNPATPATRAQTGIQQFGRVSKASPATGGASSKKRKAVVVEEEGEKTQTRKKQVVEPPPQTPAETPTKGARRLLAGLGLKESLRPLKLAAPTDTPSPVYDTPPTSPCSEDSPVKAERAGLPAEINDLITLHSSFLTALSLHYAHNGTSSPVDIRTLTPSVAKVWGKRRVMVEDIRRSIGVMQDTKSRSAAAQQARNLHLSDYGNGKICIEIQSTKRKRGVLAPTIDEPGLNALFTTELTQRWQDHRARNTTTSRTASTPTFITELPLATVTVCTSLKKVAPLLAKGQRRLEDLKSGAIKAQTAPGSTASSLAPPTTTPAKPAASATNRSTSLLDRILAKQSLAAAAPAGPTKAEQDRQAALHRAEDVLSLLNMMAAAKGNGLARASFTLQQVVQSARESARTPMAREEVEGAVRLLGTEIVPGYVGVVETGGLTAVVVNLGARVAVPEVRRRLGVAGMK